jgi:hypothetical protein
VLPRDTRRRDPSPSAYSWHSGKRLLPRVLAHGTRGRGHLRWVLEHGTWEDIFHFFGKRFRPKAPSNAKFLLWLSLVPECCTRGRRLSPSVTLPRVPWVLRHSGKPLFPECNTREDWLPWVPDFWHSGKSLALREFRFSRSGSKLQAKYKMGLHAGKYENA